MFCHELEDTITGSESFPGKILTPINKQVDLPDDVFKCLITYYNEAYDDINVEFISMTDFIEQDLQNEVSNQYTIVQPKIDQCGRIRVAAKIFGSVLALQYKKNSHILAKFIQCNNLIELFPGQVQYYFDTNCSFQPVSRCIGLLMSNGIYQSETDFTVELKKIIKVLILNFGIMMNFIIYFGTA